jgi:glutaminyl-peptide cyclotransferase
VRSLLLAVAALVIVGCESEETSRTRPPFDGKAALEYARAQVNFGPRVPGTEAAKKAGDWIIAQMKSRADTVIVQEWEHTTHDGKKLPMRNIIARFNPAATERVLYVTHWDSRPISDGAKSLGDTAAFEKERSEAVPGANDGASGVGMFVALGDLLKKKKPVYGVDLLFVDGEDYGEFGPPEVDVLIGAKYFAQHLPDNNYQPVFGVVWDMIGDADLVIHQDVNSAERAPEVVALVWKTAAELGYTDAFMAVSKYPVVDDHIPLLDAGLRVIDVIDLDYPYHHRPSDTMDKISAQSLQTVGEVAASLVLQK